VVSYVFKRLVACIPVLLVVSIIVFLAMRLLPGDPIDALYPAEASVSEETRALLRESLGLNSPLPIQYGRWLLRLTSGDLGTSIRLRRPIAPLLLERARATATLVLGSTTLALLLAIPLGILAALNRGNVTDRAVTITALLGLSIPEFALGTFLALLFGVWLNWFPTIGDLVLPVLTQGLVMTGLLVRNIRATVIDQLSQDYVRTARGKGLRSTYVQLRHVLPNALPIILSLLAAVVGYALGGAIVVEQIFAWPGLGLLLFEAISLRDYPVVQSVVLFTALSYVVVNLIVDILRATLDIRLRTY
jgi:ABC-type dipeptide/oligopeptide/nickel transport system permease component